MGGFFGLIFGICFLIIRGLIELNKQTKETNNFNYKTKLEDIEQNKLISKHRLNNNLIEYYENITGQKVYKSKDNDGIPRWRYVKNNQLIPDFSNIKEYQNFKETVIANNIINYNQKWIILKNFWEDSLIRDDNNCDPKTTYLDDFRVAPDVTREEKWIIQQRKNGIKGKINSYLNRFEKNSILYQTIDLDNKKIIDKYFYDNDPLNQKIYYKNLRPYQLAGIYKENEDGTNIIVYLIRFGKKELSLTETHNIYDKQNIKFWTKWYAITKEEFESLTNLNKGKLWCPSNLIYKDKKEITMLKYYMKQVELSDVAFYNSTNNYCWFLNDTLKHYGIQKAFDVNGNFIGDYNE